MPTQAKKGKIKKSAIKKVTDKKVVKGTPKKLKVAPKKTKSVKKSAATKAKKIVKKNVKKAPAKKVAPKKLIKKVVPKKKVVAKKTKVKASKKPVAKKVAIKKPVVKKVIAKKSVVKTNKSTNPVPKKIVKTAELAKKPTVKVIPPVKTVKLAKPVRKGPPVAIPAMNHKTIAEKIEERKAAPMKLVASQINIAVVGPVPSIPPYRVSPGEEYMNEKQEQHFLEVLQAWKQQLMEDVDKTVNHLKDDAENYADLNDRATQEEEFNLELRTRDRERKLLKKIDETIALIENGDFGYCEACGVEIGLPRLEVRPTATQCIDCKTVEEIREKQLTL